MPSPVGPRAPSRTPDTLGGPGSPGCTMTERCSLWSALSAAACCFYRGSLVQVQVRGRHGDPGHCARSAVMGTAVREHPRRVVRAGPGAKGGGGVAPSSPRGTQGAPRGTGPGGHSSDSGLQEMWERVGTGTRLGGGFPPVCYGVPAADPEPPGSPLYQGRRAGV